MCVLTKPRALWFATTFRIAVTAIAIAAVPSLAGAQSADLVLCDRLAADPADPDKPADAKGVAEIEPSDIATAIKFCKHRVAVVAPRAVPARPRLRRQPANAGSHRRLAQGGRQGLDLGHGRTRRALRHRRWRCEGRSAGAKTVRARGASRQPARHFQSCSVQAAAPPPILRRRAALLAKAGETNAEAQYQLGMMIADGVGGPQDDVTARALFEKAAAQNHPGALERMGAFAQEGRGGDKDATAAKAYYEKAAAFGNEDAKAALKRLECPYVIKDKRGNFVTNLCF